METQGGLTLRAEFGHRGAADIRRGVYHAAVAACPACRGRCRAPSHPSRPRLASLTPQAAFWGQLRRAMDSCRSSLEPGPPSAPNAGAASLPAWRRPSGTTRLLRSRQAASRTKLPDPHPGSSTLPPSKPRSPTARHMAATTSAGVASLDAQMFDVDVQGLGDAQPEETQRASQGLVNDAAGAALGDERAQLHAVEAQGGRLGIDLGPADVLGRRVLDRSIDDGEAVEAGHGGQATTDGGPGQAPLLHRAGVQLDVAPAWRRTPRERTGRTRRRTGAGRWRSSFGWHRSSGPGSRRWEGGPRRTAVRSA